MSQLSKHPNCSYQNPTLEAWDFTVTAKSPILCDDDAPTIEVITQHFSQTGEIVKVNHIHFSECYNVMAAKQRIAKLPNHPVFPIEIRGKYVTKKIANNYGYFFTGRDWESEDQIDFDGPRTCRYHSSDSIDLTTYEDVWRFGIEVEKVDSFARDLESARSIQVKTNWRKEEDGSLSEGGYEMVSPIMPLYDDKVILENLQDDGVGNLLNGDINETCGGHITLSHKHLSSTLILRRLKFFAPILYAMYHKRVTNRFCQAKPWRVYFRGRNKYQAFYLKTDRLLEIRIPTAYDNVKQAKWRIGLMRIMLSDSHARMGFVSIVKKITDGKSPLSRHFLQVYTFPDLIKMLLRSCQYSIQFMPIAPNDVRRMEEYLLQLQEQNEALPVA
jgi:hypothetical protein